ncbi:MAG TPA: restriction endonuclease subunit S, partial [Thermodesulfobacteriota bacterium]|nr:restriction endonuclease subunit S [Thermodesulfobacteriota bacterium]
DISAVSHNEGITVAESMLFGDAPPRARRKAKVGDVVISTVRTYLKAVASVDETHADCVFSTGFAILRARQKKLKPEFLKWLALNDLLIQAIESHSEGLSYPAINTSELVNLKTVVPGLSEQTRISLILDRETARIDALIAKKTRFIELLKEKRQALITHAVTKGLNPNVKMKDSGVEWIGQVPEHWQTKRLKHLLEEPLQYGANESGDASIEDGPRYIRITDLNEAGELRHDSVKRLSPFVAQPYMLRDGDVLFARSGATVGKTYCYRSEHGPACFAGYLIRARLNRRKINPDFLILAVQSHYYWAYILKTAIQATIENVSAERYGDFPVAMPNCKEQNTIIAVLSSILARIDTLTEKTQRSINLLKERRSAFITAAVTGQIDLRESI